MLLSGKMLIVGLHVSAEEGMVRAWHIDTGSDVVLPGRHRVRPCSLPIASTSINASYSCLQHLHVLELQTLHDLMCDMSCQVCHALALS